MTERYQLYEGDCLEVMKRFEPASFHAIIVDLPYGLTDCAWDARIPLRLLWEQFKRLIKSNGATILFGSQPFTTDLIISNRTWFKYDLVWDKHAVSNIGNAKLMPLRSHESILIFCEGTHTYNPQLRKDVLKPFGKLSATQSKVTGAMGIDYQMGVGYPKSIVSFMRPNNLSDGGLHPTQKPLDLLKWLVKTYTNPGDVVLDCCYGSGTCGVACMETGRKFVGIEKDSHYFALGAQRIADAHRAAQGLPKELRGKDKDFDDMPLFAATQEEPAPPSELDLWMVERAKELIAETMLEHKELFDPGG